MPYAPSQYALFYNSIGLNATEITKLREFIDAKERRVHF